MVHWCSPQKPGTSRPPGWPSPTPRRPAGSRLWTEDDSRQRATQNDEQCFKGSDSHQTLKLKTEKHPVSLTPGWSAIRGILTNNPSSSNLMNLGVFMQQNVRQGGKQRGCFHVSEENNFLLTGNEFSASQMWGYSAFLCLISIQIEIVQGLRKGEKQEPLFLHHLYFRLGALAS